MENISKKAVCNLFDVDGNAYSLMAHWEECAKRSGFSGSEIEKILEECTSKDYNHLVKTLQNYCE